MGSKMCKATGFLLTFLGIASIYNLTVIALFRYLVIEWSNVSYPKEMVKYNVLCLEDQFCETQQKDYSVAGGSLMGGQLDSIQSSSHGVGKVKSLNVQESSNNKQVVLLQSQAQKNKI